jgi:hypothetical protein
MKTRHTLAVLTLAAGSLLFLALESGATAEAPSAPDHLWCFSYPHFNVEAVTCVELPVAPLR